MHLDRVKRLRDARTEAAKDISELQKSKNEELQEIQEQSANQTDLSEGIQKDTDEKLIAVKDQFEKNKQAAIDKLVEAVTLAK